MIPTHVTTRQELQSKMQHTICSLRRPPSTREAWTMEIYDAQIEGRIVRPRSGVRMTSAEVNSIAHHLAARNYHHGLASGQCRNGSAWVMSSPSPEPLARYDGDTFLLSDKNLQTYCREIRFDFAAAIGGPPRLIRAVTNLGSGQDLRISTALLDDGILSITCQPQISAQGPVVWYLLPIKGGPAAKVPFPELLASPKLTPAAQLAQWVNRVRLEAGLNRLGASHFELKATAKQLAKSISILHDHSQLKRQGKRLELSGGSIIGENRVKAASLNEMAWLLWNSPRHRSLILNANATQFEIQTRKLKVETLAVLVFAKF